MHPFRTLLALLCLSFSATLAHAQGSLCNANGNLVVFANYDGGVLNINCDVNIPNLKIGVCTYEPVTVNITGAFASNVTEVRYAGYVATNNNHCNNSPSTTTITGVPSNISSVNFLPPATLSNPNGWTSIVCAYSCNTTSSQGGCNTADQVVDYFQTTMGGTLRSYFTQYGCWSSSAYTVSNGGNCCPAGTSCAITVSTGPDTLICPGNSAQLQANVGGMAPPYTYSWSPATGLSNPNVPNPTATPSTTTTYVLTVSVGPNCAASDTITVQVANPQVTFSPLSALCESAGATALTGASPSGGQWSGPGVNNNAFDPAAAGGAGTYTLDYSAVSQGCPVTAQTTIEVLADPVVTLDPIADQCANGTAAALTGSPVGGVFSGTGVSQGSFDPSIAGTGMHAVTYSYTDSSGCMGVDTYSVMVHPIPATPTISQSAFDSLTASIPGDSFQWFLGGVPLAGSDQSIQVTQSGLYTVIVWQNGCASESSSNFTYTAVGIGQGFPSRFTYFPNPVSDRLVVEGRGGEFEVELYDLRGQLLLRRSGCWGETRLDMTGLAAGTYLLRISDGEGMGFGRVLRE